MDLGEPTFTNPLCLSFRGKVCALSKQKFSSNVIEKCLRVADADTRRILIEEMLPPTELEKLLRDSFANYVIQTALDYADDKTFARLKDQIQPFLPTIRHMPYCRRIISRLSPDNPNSRRMSADVTNGLGTGPLTPMTPRRNGTPVFVQTPGSRDRRLSSLSGLSSVHQSPAATYGSSMAPSYPTMTTAGLSQRFGTPGTATHMQHPMSQAYGTQYRAPQANGVAGFF